jgi:hypothetical protein
MRHLDDAKRSKLMNRNAIGCRVPSADRASKKLAITVAIFALSVVVLQEDDCGMSRRISR